MLTSQQQQAMQVLAKHFAKDLSIETQYPTSVPSPLYNPHNVISWAEHNFYIPETQYPIRLLPHQKVILSCMFHDPRFKPQTIIYSCPKKSGKTAIASMVGRWAAETWGRYNEIYCVANDEEQAKGRLYNAIVRSIDLDPASRRRNSVLMLQGRWYCTERGAKCINTGSSVKPLSGDYKGEAGSNPTLTLWTELWGYVSSQSKRLWSELTPVPTRLRSLRFVETYAGYEGESELLWDLWQKAVQEGRQLTRDDVPDWPFDGPIPLYYNEPAKLFAYIDTGPEGRRMPWQTPEYYEAEAHDLTPDQFERLHNNRWVTSKSEFIPFEWWARLREPMPVLPSGWPIVIGVDAAVSSDCCAVVGVCRDPRDTNKLLVPFYKIWYPPAGGKFDYGETLEPELRWRIVGGASPWYQPVAVEEHTTRLDAHFPANISGPAPNYNIVQVCYDEYQLHDLMTRLRREGLTWFKQFSQANPRAAADKMLYDIIRDQRIHHEVGADADEHIRNADAKQSTTEDTKLRLVKRRESGKIDFDVALSMAAYETMRLNL